MSADFGSYSSSILQVVKQISHLKTPGLDGMHAIFYQKYWNILGKNIYCMIKAFLPMTTFLERLITLITMILEKGESRES